MILNFKNLIIHNFLSYGHAELDLTNKHYCLVKGENKSLIDNATSNGAGKSSWSSAICWALTGETIQGLSSNIKNINIDENLCYVEVTFTVDNDEFRVCRYKNPKSDLKITFNGNDISGKGIRESEEVLSRYLPDLTSQLIASIIILGQGLPNKFTANSPSGRKEVLEKLSKSDFMIQDLKTRISNRQQYLNDRLRESEDRILTYTTQKDMTNSAIQRMLDMLNSFLSPQQFDVNIFNIEKELSSLNIKLKDLESEESKLSEQSKSTYESYLIEIKNRDDQLLLEDNEFNEFKALYLEKRSTLSGQIQALEAAILKIESIKDICPTCGQKLPNVHKPDATSEKSDLISLETALKDLELKYFTILSEHTAVRNEIIAKNASNIETIDSLIKQINQSIDVTKKDANSIREQITSLTIKLNQQMTEKAELQNKIKSCENEVKAYREELSELSSKLESEEKSRDNLKEHLQAVSQMSTLIKRDFRGYLLSEIIGFISAKSKEYCLNIFGTDAIEFTLDGNNINIAYAGKSFENLSGGEKQRIDLIIQFAIRNMMNQYLNFSSNILVLDEIFDQLDAVGCESVLELITSKLADVESIFIISHRADELEIPCDYELTVIKDEQGVSTIKCQ